MGTFVLLTSVSVIGMTGFAIHYSKNTVKIYENSKIQDNNTVEITDKIDLINKDDKILKQLINKINDLEYKIIKLTETQEHYLIELKKQPIPLLTVRQADNISSISSFSSLIEDSSQIQIHSYPQINTYHQINNNDEEDELINECYDSIPLNNNKKVTGIKGWLF